jgi:basic amino acid/polyamine antiporter, APA family
VQSLFTALKIAGILLVIGGVFFISPTASWTHLAAPANAPQWSGFALFGTAMLAALWGYDGWNNMPMAAGEVKNPGRNIPIALIAGMVVVMALYCLMNLSYFYALPFDEVLTANSTKYRDALPTAAKAAQTFLGGFGGKLISIAFVVSAFGALNGSILSNARVPFAMARDGKFFQQFGNLSEGTRVPVFALIVQGVWSCVLALSGTFDQLTDCLLFASWIFYGLVTSSVFVLRRKMPNADRPYKTFGYPVIPLVFVLVALWLIINTLFTKPVESVVGLVLMALGLPLYWYFSRPR